MSTVAQAFVCLRDRLSYETRCGLCLCNETRNIAVANFVTTNLDGLFLCLIRLPYLCRESCRMPRNLRR